MKQDPGVAKNLRYNRILLERIPEEFERPYALRPGTEVMLPDLSALQFLIEEFTSLAAMRIAIPEDSEVESAVDYLHPALKKRVAMIDKKRKSYPKYAAILAPLQEEFEVKLTRVDYPGAFAIVFKKDASEELRRAVAFLFFNLRTFLLGIDYQLQIDIELKALKEATEIVRHRSQSRETRMMLACLSGLLETYDEQTITCLGFLPEAYEENVSAFKELVDDQMYKLMSSHTHSLGFPSLLKRSILTIRRLSKQVVTKSPYKQILTLGTRVISTATKIPIPDSDWAASLLKKHYLPPVVRFERATQRAYESWISLEHEPIAPKGFGPWGFVRIPGNVDVKSWIAEKRVELE